MNKFILWGSTHGFSKFICDNTLLQNESLVDFRRLPESDISKPNDFHRLPTHIKNIQYLDSPDLIIELNGEPILSIEISREAGTGHNVFQRFARIAAAVENNVPCIYIYPEAVIVYRKKSGPKWDVINPLIFFALEKLSRIYANAPALLYYYPSFYRDKSKDFNDLPISGKGLKQQKDNGDIPFIDTEMEEMFKCINEIIRYRLENKNTPILSEKHIAERLSYMQQEYYSKEGTSKPNMSPISSTITVPSKSVIDYFSKVKVGIPDKHFKNTIWEDREETIIYAVDSKFRGDPYPGCLAALDYILTRKGKTYEEREYNLVIAWGDVSYDLNTKELIIYQKKEQSIETLFDLVKKNDLNQDILTKKYSEIKFEQLSRYFMHLRFGSTFSKPKHIRVYSYFADAILFSDGAIWREN